MRIDFFFSLKVREVAPNFTRSNIRVLWERERERERERRSYRIYVYNEIGKKRRRRRRNDRVK